MVYGFPFVASLGLRGGPCPARTWAWLDDDPNDPSRAANAAPAFFMGRLVETSFTQRPIKKAAQNTARLGSLVAPLGLEPRHTVPKTAVLPIRRWGIVKGTANVARDGHLPKCPHRLPFRRLERNIPVLALGPRNRLILQHAKGAQELGPGFVRKNHLVHVAAGCGLVGVGKSLGVLGLFLGQKC
jgi:hypothetical protein